VTPNPKDREVEAGFQRYADSGSDVIVAVGGGSCIDAAKGVAILSANGGRILGYEGVDQVVNPIPPLVMAPSTSGTGADVSQFCIVTDTVHLTKVTIISRTLVPDISIIDPRLLTTMPDWLNAATGLDALTHAVESYVSLHASLFTRAFSAQAIRTLARVLPAAAEAARMPGADRRATMEAMLYAANIAGRAMLGRLGQVHALSHVVSAHYDTVHGYTNAVLLTSVLAHHQEALRPALAEIGYLLGDPGCAPGADEARGPQGRGGRAIDGLARLREAVGAPSRLRELGVPHDALHRLAADATIPEPSQNPGPATRDDFLVIYERAW
jgi:1,3-propanediol dehydrogenase